MNTDNRPPQDQADGLDQCSRCGVRFYCPEDEDRCPECGRMLSPEVRITFEMQKRCPWGGPIREGEEAEVHCFSGASRWVWINLSPGLDIDDRETAAAHHDAASLDRLLGYLTRMDLM